MAPTNTRIVIALLAALAVAAACGEQQTGDIPEPIEFSYQVPRAIDDGWATGSLAEVGIAQAPVVAAFKRILEGERYPAIHGVVVVRHRILVLEQYYSGRTMAADPGAEFLYNTGSSLLLNDLHSMIAGKRGDYWADEVLYDRIDSRPVADSWPPLATGLIPRDMAKIGQIMLDGGMWQDTRIVSADWVSASIEPYFQFDERRGYGYLWWLRTFQTTGGEVESFYASGNGGQFIFVFPALDMVIVFTGGNFGSPLMNRPLELLEDHFVPAAM